MAQAAGVDVLADVVVPFAEIPSKPSGGPGPGRLTSTPDFSAYSTEMSKLQAVTKELEQVTIQGKRLVHVLLAKLHRNDEEGTAQVMQSIEALPSPRHVMGEEHWSTVQTRLDIYEHGNYGSFAESYLAVLVLHSFIYTGTLLVEMPEAFRVGCVDQDDERLMRGLVHGVEQLERYAVGRGRELDLRSVRLALRAAECVEHLLSQLDLRNGELRRSYDGVKYCIKKLENMAYEIDLALQRAGGSMEEDAAPSESSAAPAMEVDKPYLIDLAAMRAVKERYDTFDALREQAIKRTRDIAKGAKNAVYALHRGDFTKADSDLKLCTQAATAIHNELVSQAPTLRSHLINPLEEMAEALALKAFLQERRLASFEELQAASGLPFRLTFREYFGGILDLTGEVARIAIRAASKGRDAIDDVQLGLSCVDAVYSGMQEIPFLPMALTKKSGPLKSSMTKLEGVLYELALLSKSGRRPQALAPEGDGEAAA